MGGSGHPPQGVWPSLRNGSVDRRRARLRLFWGAKWLLRQRCSGSCAAGLGPGGGISLKGRNILQVGIAAVGGGALSLVVASCASASASSNAACTELGTCAAPPLPDAPVVDAVPEAAPDAGAEAAVDHTRNPDGVPYPLDHLGWAARAGSVRGDRIANLVMKGYPAGASTLGTVSMADLYDPQGTRHDVVIVLGHTLWDPPSKGMITALKGSTKRIARFLALAEGDEPSKTASLADLSPSRASYPSAFHGFDPSFAQLRPALDEEAIPLVIILDARTMEITRAAVGAITTVAAIDDAVSAITSRAPSY